MGFKSIYSGFETLFCIQHLKDLKDLKVLGAKTHPKYLATIFEKVGRLCYHV